MSRLLDEFVEHFISDVLDHVGCELFDEPRKHLFFVFQIAVVKARNLLLKVDERRDVIDTIFASHRFVVDLHKRYACVVVAVVVIITLTAVNEKENFYDVAVKREEEKIRFTFLVTFVVNVFELGKNLLGRCLFVVVCK